MILSLVSRHALSQDVAVFAKSEGLITTLKNLKPAPYDGILLNETAFRFYVNNADTNLILTNELKDCHRMVQEKSGEVISNTAIAAFILGGLSVYYLKH